ncbi:MAG: group II intron maturase-specific domain-containing protein [Candidatus Binatia bacterium]
MKFSRHRKLKEVLEQIRPVIVGWVNYFRVGNARRAFGWICFEMMRKIRPICDEAERPPWLWLEEME